MSLNIISVLVQKVRLKLSLFIRAQKNRFFHRNAIVLVFFLTIKRIMLLSGLILLTQCANLPDNSHLQVNQQLVSPYTMSADVYLSMAKNQTGIEKQSLLLKAAGRLIHDGHWQQGRQILTRMRGLPLELTQEKTLLLAQIDLIREKNQAAIAMLAQLQDVSSLALYYQVQYHEMLAHAYQATNKEVESVSERIKLNDLLPDAASRANNLRSLWLTLTTLPAAELNTMAIESDDRELKGWMQLARLARKDYEKPDIMLNSLMRWKQEYPHHPANAILSIEQGRAYLFPKPQKMALLLPLSGPLSGPGEAIRDGFMAAYKASNEIKHANIQFYDSNQANVVDLYHQAVSSGAQYIVGPLRKDDAAKVASLEHPVPTLLLNDLNRTTKPNGYQFGLSPTREARQVATKARKNGHTRALVIAPNGLWGEEVVQAFTQQWQANGGVVVDKLMYQKKEPINQAIRDVLHITESLEREKKLKALLGRKLETTPRRRQDFDMIFLLAYPSKARQIMPLLKYYYAGDIPVYATSSVYGGSPDPLNNRDLNGIIFCDMPWVFSYNVGNRHWPETLNSYNRLYALGMDAFELATQLNQLLLFPAMGVRDNSGILYLTPTRNIARILAWGEFKSGLVKPLNENRLQ